MSRPWKTFLRAVAFLCVLALILAGASAIVYPKTNKTLRKYKAGGILGEPKNSLDYVFVGNSNVAEGFSPLDVWQLSGASGYACAEPWKTLCGTYYMLRQIFQYQKPSLVMLDTDSFFYSQKFQNAADTTIGTILEENLPVFRYHNNWKHLSPATLFQKPQFTWQDKMRGHTIGMDIRPAKNSNYMRNRTEGQNVIYPLIRFYFSRIEALCRENGAQLLIVSIPNAAVWNTVSHDAIQTFAAQKGVPYLDLNEYQSAIGLDWQTDTRDGGNHLNAEGAQKISIFLADYLEGHYSLPDHRDDAAYASWDSDYASYIEKLDS